MKRKLIFFLIILSLIIPNIQAAESENDGKHFLFMGHSYFMPVSKRFHDLLKQTEIENHLQDSVAAGGGKGAPGALWKNKANREKAENFLSSGKIEVLGMTRHIDNSSYEDYKRWVDLALSSNPKTKFFIGNPWPMKGGTVSIENYENVNIRSDKQLLGIVSKLRKAYPNNDFLYLNYGEGTVQLKRLFENGKLPGITEIIGKSNNALFRDSHGHGGPIVIDLAALIWMRFFYDIDVSNIKLDNDYGDYLKKIAAKFDLSEN